MEEIQEWVKKCPIRRLEERLIRDKVFTKVKAKKIREEVEKEIEEAVAFANQSPFPEPKDIYEDVYV